MVCRDGIYTSPRSNHPNNGFIETNETENPVYEPGNDLATESHLYCTIPEVMAERAREAVYINQAKPTSHYEEPRYLQPLEQPNKALPPEERMYEDVSQA